MISNIKITKELEDLAVEFAEWILQHKNPSFSIISGYKSPITGQTHAWVVG